MVNMNNLTLPVRFRGAGTFAPRSSTSAFLRTFDFDELGRSTVKQNMLLYAGVILSRLGASAVRGQEIDSYNEVREHAVRDLFGWLFWFLAVDPIKRTYLRFAPEEYRDLLVHNPYQEPLKSREGLWTSWKERVKKEASFIFKGGMPTAEQLDNRKTQMMKKVREAAGGWGDEAVKVAEGDVEKVFHKLTRFRSFASGIGIVLAIALLGVGIPLINILTTQKNVAERETERESEKQGDRPNPWGSLPSGFPDPVQPPFAPRVSRVYQPSYLR